MQIMKAFKKKAAAALEKTLSLTFHAFAVHEYEQFLAPFEQFAKKRHFPTEKNSTIAPPDRACRITEVKNSSEWTKQVIA